MNRDTEFEQAMSSSANAAPSASLTRCECEALWNALMMVPSEGVVVEVGCQLGRSSALINRAQRLIGFHAIHIDPYTSQQEIARTWLSSMMNFDPLNHEFTLCCMRTAQAWWLLDRIAEIDLAFIDGDHQYEAVTIDMETIATKIIRRGILACHDYASEVFPDVKKAVDEFLNPGWHTVGQFDSLGVWLRK